MRSWTIGRYMSELAFYLAAIFILVYVVPRAFVAYFGD